MTLIVLVLVLPEADMETKIQVQKGYLGHADNSGR